MTKAIVRIVPNGTKTREELPFAVRSRLMRASKVLRQIRHALSQSSELSQAAAVAALATVKINPLKARVLGSGDALVMIDGDRWMDFEEPEQRAILDHELTHLELVYDDDGELPEAAIEAAEANPTKERPRPIRLDDEGRPRLRIRLHDHQFGWFDDVVARHGRQAVEWAQFEKFRDGALQQLWLPGLGLAPAPAESDEAKKGRKGAA